MEVCILTDIRYVAAEVQVSVMGAPRAVILSERYNSYSNVWKVTDFASRFVVSQIRLCKD